jgi:hypothetical protein
MRLLLEIYLGGCVVYIGIAAVAVTAIKGSGKTPTLDVPILILGTIFWPIVLITAVFVALAKK